MEIKKNLLIAAILTSCIFSSKAQTSFNFKPGPTAAEGKEFLQQNKKMPGVKVIASGLQYKVLKKGEGSIPSSTDKVSIIYNLALLDGKKIAIGGEKEAWEHHLDKALPAMREAILLMPVGSKWKLYIPAELGFGNDLVDNIPAGSVLTGTLELVKIIK